MNHLNEIREDDKHYALDGVCGPLRFGVMLTSQQIERPTAESSSSLGTRFPANMAAETIERGRVAEGLARLLADSYTLLLRTQNYHWNVTGPMFQTLHLMFEAQYVDLAQAVDEIAERIRALGFSAPATYSEFAELSSISDGRGVPSAERMIEMLNDGHTAVALTAKNIFTATTESNDVSTADLLTRRITTHEKTAWMLRSLLM